MTENEQPVDEQRSSPETAPETTPDATTSTTKTPAVSSADYDALSVDDLLRLLEVAKSDVQELKVKVAAANKKKETAFRAKQDVGKSIGDKIGEISGSKHERNAITAEVRDLKRQRDALNAQIREKVAEIKKLTEENKDALAKATAAMSTGRDRDRRAASPGFLKKQIEEMEFKLETQPMGFDAEQKANKKLKEMKKQYAELKGSSEAFELIREKSREIDQLKREANKYHRQVQEHAQQSQAKHENLLTESKEIDDLKKNEQEKYDEFLALKKEYTDLNNQLKEKVAEMQRIKDALSKQNVKVKEEAKQEELKTLKERAHEAEEKVRTKKKLTTEDLLALQGLNK